MGYNTRGIDDLYDQFRYMMRYIIAFVFLLGFSASALAQAPAPQAIQGSHTGPGHVVGIRGVGFGTDKTKLAVYFGAAKAAVTEASDQLVEVIIPTGATYDNISVTNTNTGVKLTGYTPQNFLMSFGGDFGFDVNNLEAQQNFQTEPGLFDQCLCDFNNDGKVDIVTASQNNATLAIFTNISTPGAINFSKTVIPTTGALLHAKCGDLNGDGKPDLVFSESANGERIFVLQNNTSDIAGSTISFSPSIIALTQTLKKPKQIQIVDLDMDGKPEIIATDLKKTNETGNVNIFINQSSGGTLAFSTNPITLPVPGTTSTDALAVKDLNDDGKPEIVTSQYAIAPSNLYVAGNKSTPGNISFDAFVQFGVSPGGAGIIKVGDLDGDGKPDVAMSFFLNGVIGILRNTSSGTAFSFATPAFFPGDASPAGLDIGDLDGDGKPDLVTTSFSGKTVTFLNNSSTPGTFNFQPQTKATTEVNRHVYLGDMDGDAKPDVAFTSISTSKLSVFRNKTCMVPKIVPEGPLIICAGTQQKLNVTVSAGTTYEWQKDGATQSTTPDAFYNADVAGSYTVIAKAEGGACSRVSNAVSLSVSGAGSGSVTLPSIPPVCKGSLATIAATDPGTGLTFKWTGPNNYTGVGATATVPNFQAVNAGRYNLDVYVGSGPGSCLYQQLSTVVEMSAVDNSFGISPGNSQICQGSTKLLSVTPRAGFTYQWRRNGSDLGGETSPSYSAGAGSYTVKAKPPGCSEVETDPVVITALALPVASFANPAKACQGQLVQFNNTSSVDPAATPVYTWDFGDGQTSSDAQPSHQYTATGSPTIKLTVAYVGCTNTKPDGSITISPAPPVQIVNPETSGLFKFCEGDSLKLTVAGIFKSYAWSNGGTDAAVYFKTGGIISVNATTTDGCVLFDDQTLVVDPAPKIEVTATPPQINEGESTQLDASAGLTHYNWTPDDGTLSAINTPSATATPLVTTTYLVSASSGAGCPGRGSIEVTVRGEPIVNKLNPGKFFSPNGDDKNPTWMVDRIEEFSQCGVSIYDDKGVKVFESKPYVNDWDGTFKGKKLPDGVYYYIIRCDGEEGHPRTGSITVLR